MRVEFRLLFLFLLIPSLCWAELIYNPLTKESVYDYNGDYQSFKNEDFKCVKEVCYPFNINQPKDIQNGILLDGFEFWAWERGYNIPKKSYMVFTFMIKQNGEFIWYPYSLEEINNLMGQ